MPAGRTAEARPGGGRSRVDARVGTKGPLAEVVAARHWGHDPAVRLCRAPDLPDAERHRAACVLYLTSQTSIDWENRFVDAMGDFDVAVYIAASRTEDGAGLEWMLKVLESVSVIGMWLDPASPAGDLELELGLAAATGHLVIGAPATSSMRPLADIIARRYDVPLADDLGGFVQLLRARVTSATHPNRDIQGGGG